MPFAQFTATGNGSTKQFTIPFPYVKKDHIVVALNNVTVTGFAFINDNTIEFDTISSATSTQETSGAPKNGVGIEITRDTPLTSALVDFVDGSTLTAGDLDTAVLQLLYGIQEAKDEAALGIQNTPQGQDAQSKPIINVADPTNAQDAVTKAFLERVGSITSTQIADGTIVNADVNASAAIAGTKISPDFGSQNIATSGTVDGRDVSADGTKLDTVETGATADQTNAEIKTAYEANSNTNNFTDALLAKLNAIEANATTDQTIAEIKSLIAGSPLDASHLAADSVTSSELAANSVDSSELVDGSVDTSHLSADCVDATKIADNAIGSEHLQANSVTTSEIADAELSTLAGMQSATASKLADSTALTSDIADLNQIDGMTKQTTITNSDSHFPTSGAVVDFVADQIAPVGGLEVIADEDSFPATQPVSGVVISIANIDGLIVNSSGVATNARTVGSGSDNVTINNFPASLRSKTMAAELGLLVSSTGASQTYNYHKLLAKEADVEQLSNDINDFAARYRVGSSNPTSDLDAGDLFFNTSTQKLLVYNSTNSAWEEAQSIGNFFISTFSESFDGSRTDFTVSNAPANAQQIILSINGVVQKPNSGTSTPSEGFALSGSTVKLAAAPASGSDVFIVVMGSTVNIGTPSNNTVTSAILQNGSVIEAKLGVGAVTNTKLSLISTSSVAGLIVKGDGSSDGYLQLNCSQNSHGIKLKSPPHSAGQSYTLTFPSNIVNGQFLKTDANGNLSWAAVVTDLVNDTSPQLGGDLQSNGNDIDFADNDKAIFGTSGNLEIYSTGSESLIHENATGNLKIKGTNLRLADSSDNLYMFMTSGAGIKMYHNGSKKFETASHGVEVTGKLTFAGDGHTQGIELGADADIVFYHDNSDGYLDNNVGDLYLRNDGSSTSEKVRIQAKGGEQSIICNPNGAVELYHDNNKKFETTSYGAAVTGYVTQSALPSACVYGAGSWTVVNASTATHPLAMFPNTAHNVGSMYNNSTGKMTAPVAGIYSISINLFCQGIAPETDSTSNAFEIYIRINGNTVSRHHNKIGYGNLGDNQQVMSLNCIEDLSANDEVTIYVGASSGGNWQMYGSHSNFQMALLG